jgi:tetratricopeptide (TPR) repeat protein
LVSRSGPSRSAQAFRDIVAGLQRESAVDEAGGEDEIDDALDDGILDAAQPGEEVSTSGALLALVEELEASMGMVVESDASDPVSADLPGTESTVGEDSETDDDLAALISEPAAEIGDDDFDALLASLSVRGATTPLEAEPSAAHDEPESAFLRESEPAPEVIPEPEPEVTSEPEVEAGPTPEVTDDWDALLDAMSVGGEASASEPQATLVPAKPTAGGALAEAEQLMQVLEKRPKTAPPVSASTQEPVAAVEAPARAESVIPAVPLVPTAMAVTVPSSDGRDEEPALGYDFNAAPSRRRSRRHSRGARRGLKLLKVLFYLVLLGGLAATLWIYVAAPMLLQDEDLAVRAERLMAARDYSAASQTYLQLASRMAPGDLERANAEFRAAYALTLGPETSGDDTKRRYGTALSLFKQFTETYPQHPKRARALSLMGRLHFELQAFEEAITVLRDQVKPADDPAAALSMLRYLARAYSMTGQYEQAETSYLQAATLPGNYNAEADYLELGDLFRQRAGLENDPVARKPLEEMAMSYWRRAMQVPGVAPGDRNTLEERLQWLTFTEQNAEALTGDASPASPAVGPTATPEALPTGTSPTATPEVPAPPTSTIPVAADETGRAEVPGAELEALAPPVSQAAQ